MAARSLTLRVLVNIEENRRTVEEKEKRREGKGREEKRREICISAPSVQVICFVLYKHQLNTNAFNLRCLWRDLLCNHSKSDFFTCVDNVHTIFTCEDIVFSRESLSGIFSVFIKQLEISHS